MRGCTGGELRPPLLASLGPYPVGTLPHYLRPAVRHTLYALTCLAVLTFAPEALAQEAPQRFSPPMVASGDGFGQSVAISEDVMVVGAPFTDDTAMNTGVAYVYRRIAQEWTLEATLLAPDVTAEDRFGIAVDISGDRALVGASGRSAAYVFRHERGIWTLETELAAPEASPAQAYGSAVALDGAVAVVASGAGAAGEALVFSLDSGEWSQVATLQSPTPGSTSQFGASVDVDGARIAIGDTGRGTGEVHVYETNGSVWEHQAMVRGTNAGGELGYSVALDGDRLLAGAWLAETAAGRSGTATVYRRDASSGEWAEEAELIQPMPVARDIFGFDVDLRGDLAAVSAWGSDQGGAHAGRGHLYARGEAGWAWLREFVSDGDPIGDNFGHHVALGDDVVAWATDDESLNGERGGLIYVFAVDNATDAGAPPEPLALGIRVAPSPTSGAVRLAFTLGTPGSVRVLVLDALGRTVLAPEAYARASGEQRIALDLSALPAGVYRVHVQTEAGGGVQTVVVAR